MGGSPYWGVQHLKFICMVLLCLGLSRSTTLAQQKMWVTSEGAKLKADRTALSETLAVLPIGTEVAVLALEGRWYRIRSTSGQEGWIYRGRVYRIPPPKKAEDETGNLFVAMPGSRIKVDEADTSRSMRGLSKETEAYAKNRRTLAVYKEALDRVLGLSITPRELEAFLREGQIGEYAP